MKKIYLFLFSLFICNILAAQDQDYKIVRDISYTQSKDPYAVERCKLDLYYPENAKDFPTVVWFHGGGLSGGSKFIPEELKNCGLAVIAVNYRLLPKATLSDCIDDAAAAVAWTFNEIEKYGGDRRKIFVSGHSAGGYLTNMVGLDKKWLTKYRKGMKDTQPSIDEFAPLFYVRPDAPPLIIVSGDREMEMLGRYEENAYFWRMMKVAGHKNTYIYELDGYDHGSMAAPAFHILKNHVKAILKGSETR